MTGFVWSFALVLTFVVCSQAASISWPESCTFEGKIYHLGEKKTEPNPCQPCECMAGGQMNCMWVDCFYRPHCVDSISEKGKCCASCPNGMNCRHGTHIIKMGEVYKPDPHTSCECSRGYYVPADHSANCTTV